LKCSWCVILGDVFFVGAFGPAFPVLAPNLRRNIQLTGRMGVVLGVAFGGGLTGGWRPHWWRRRRCRSLSLCVTLMRCGLNPRGLGLKPCGLGLKSGRELVPGQVEWPRTIPTASVVSHQGLEVEILFFGAEMIEAMQDNSRELKHTCNDSPQLCGTWHNETSKQLQKNRVTVVDPPFAKFQKDWL
jgi:hypothetical protein